MKNRTHSRMGPATVAACLVAMLVATVAGAQKSGYAIRKKGQK